uniref:Minor tail protein n=1 Tax=Siphoviridae sp. ctz7e2 TaxID=2826526 RepID=A0A8S5M3M0_9CAUD|nr:MAG TPA: Minor tail protein [Siphoviridae sp. ctz7e2]
MVDGIASALRSAAAIPQAVQAMAAKAVTGLKALIDAAPQVGRAFSATARTIAGAAGDILSTWQGALAKLMPRAAEAANGIRNALASGARAAGDAVTSALRGAASAAGSAWQAATRPAAAAFNTIAAAASSVGSRISGTISGWASAAAGAMSRFAAPAVSAFNSVANAASGFGGRALSAVTGWTSQAASRVSSAMGTVGSAIGSTRSIVGSTMSSVQSIWQSAWSRMPAPVTNVVSSIGRGLSGLPGRIGGAIASGTASAVNSAATLASRIGDTLQQGVATGVRMTGLALAGLGTVITANLGGAIQRADQLNVFPKVMANIGYSSQEAGEQIKRISTSLDGLPTATDDIVRMAQSLAPLTGDLTSATDVSLALNNALLAGGASTVLAGNAMEQYRQMLAKNSVDMQGWRSMVMAMPGQMDMVAKSLLGASANSMELYDAMKTGTVSFEDFNNALLELNSNGIDGLSGFEEQARTATQGIGTAFINAGTRIKRAMAAVIDAIGVDVISKKINDLTSGIVGFGEKVAAAITKLKGSQAFDGLNVSLSTMLPVLGGLFGALGPLLSQIPLIGRAFVGLTGPVGIAIGLFAAMMANSQQLRDALGTAFKTIGEVFTSTPMKEALTGLSDSLGKVANQMGGALATAVSTIAPALASMASTVLPVLASTLGTVVEALSPIAGTIMTTIASVLAQILPVLAQLAAMVLPVIASVISRLAEALAPVIQQIATVLVGALAQLLPVVLQVAEMILPVVVDLIDQLLPVITEVITVIANLVAEILPVLVEVISAILPVLAQIVSAILPVLAPLLSAIVQVISAVVQVLAAVLVPVIRVLAAIIVPVIQVIGAVFLWLWEHVVSPVFTWITERISGFADWMVNTGVPAIQGAWEHISDAASTLWEWVTWVWGNIREAIQPFIDWMVDTGWPAIQVAWDAIVAAASTLWEWVTWAWNGIWGVINPVVTWIGTYVAPVVAAAWDVVTAAASTLWEWVTWAWNGIWSVISVVVDWIGTYVAPVVQAAWDIIAAAASNLWSWVTWAWNGIWSAILAVVNWLYYTAWPNIQGVWTGIQNGANRLWNGIVTIWNGIWTTIDRVRNWLVNTLWGAIDRVWSGIRTGAERMRDGITSAFNRVRGAAARPINFVIRTVYTNGIKTLVDKIMETLGLDLRMPTVSPIAEYASGGVLPGYTPGRDIYHFVSPDGGGRLALSGGEAIMRPEWVRAVGGRRAVNAMNSAAAGRRPIPGGDSGMIEQAFAPGGIWDAIKETGKSVAGGVSAAVNWVKDTASAVSDIVTDPAGAIENLIRTPIKALIDAHSGAGAFWDAGKKIVWKTIDGAEEWLKSHLPSLGGGEGGPDGTAVAGDLVTQARLAIGTPYVWGGVNVPGGVDCSGLIVWALRKLGYNVPRHTASTFQANSTPGSANNPGTLLFWGGSVGAGGAHHVAIASGGGRMIEAPTFGIPVREIGIYGGPSAGVFRYDQGGWLQPGTGMVTNQTRHPEAVMTGSQWDKIDRLVTALEDGALGPKVLEVRDVDDLLIGRMRVEAEDTVITYDRLNY